MNGRTNINVGNHLDVAALNETHDKDGLPDKSEFKPVNVAEIQSM